MAAGAFLAPSQRFRRRQAKQCLLAGQQVDVWLALEGAASECPRWHRVEAILVRPALLWTLCRIVGK